MLQEGDVMEWDGVCRGNKRKSNYVGDYWVAEWSCSWGEEGKGVGSDGSW